MLTFAAGLLTLASQADPAGELLEKFRSENIEERELAFRRLGELGQAAIPALEKAVRDSDQEIAGRARRLLGRLETRQKITPELREAVPDIDDIVLQGDDDACADLLLSNYPIGGRKPRHPKLVAKDFESLAPAAVRGAKSPRDRQEICWALESWGLKSGAGELVGYLRDPWMRATALKTLGSIGNANAVPAIAPLLRDSDYTTRHEAGVALVKLGAADIAVDRSIELLSHPDARMRGQAAFRLGEVGDTKAKTALAHALEDADEDVRQHAVLALVRLDGRDHLAEILRCLRESKGSAQRQAADGIAWLDTREAVPDLILLLGHRNRSVAGEAAHALGLLQAKDALGPLTRALRHRDAWIREKSMEALGHIGEAGAVPALLEALLRAEGFEIRSALSALRNLQAKEAAPWILPFLRYDKDILAAPWVRAEAAELLAAFGAPDASPAIALLLRDPHEEVRRAALDALGRLSWMEDVGPMEDLLSDKNLGSEAILALARLGRRSAIPPLLKAKEPSDFPEMRRRGRSPEDEMLFAMNRFGNPPSYARLAGLRVAWMDNRANRRTPRETIQALGRQFDLKIELDESLDADRLDQKWTWPNCRLSVAFLSDVLRRESGGELLLEQDRVRIVPESKAWAHWKAWWESERERKQP